MGVFSQDMKAYRSLLSSMSKAAQGGWLGDVTRAVAHEAVVRIKDCFDRSQDPYGKSWAPLVSRAGVPLRDKGRLKNGFLEASSPGRVAIWNVTPYARLQNYGGKVKPVNKKALRFKSFGVTVFSKGVTVPARPFMPDDRGLPAAWADKMAKVAQDVFLKASK